MKQVTIEYALRTTWQLITNMYNEKAMEYDSTMTMGFILLSIDPEGTPSTALGPKMGMEPTSLSRILNTMEERGYIERRPNPNDGRGVLIYLTEQGKEKRDLSKKTVLEFNNSILNHVDEVKMKHFFEVIDFIKAKVEKDELVNIK
ncbi:MAG: MarR family transcriptional regulator [Flavobacteriales bacterium]|nr:MarR family transcriptional regulator [Candidatus Arcticimaribacter sp.]